MGHYPLDFKQILMQYSITLNLSSFLLLRLILWLYFGINLLRDRQKLRAPTILLERRGSYLLLLLVGIRLILWLLVIVQRFLNINLTARKVWVLTAWI